MTPNNHARYGGHEHATDGECISWAWIDGDARFLGHDCGRGRVSGLHVKNGAAWALQLQGGICENETFLSNGTFFATDGEDGGDAGHWSGGGTKIHMKWTAGQHVGSVFHGPWVTSNSEKEFVGIVEPAGLHGVLDKGTVPDC